jgi:KDO2-lipid IV(A) lauroyltransferase
MTPQPNPTPESWLNPRHWPLALGLGLLWLGAQLPLVWSQSLGRGLGALAYVIFPSRRRIVSRNLQLCFPSWTEDKRAKIVRANFASSGIGLIEGGMAWWSNPTRLQRMVRFEGMEHLERAKSYGRGVLVLGAHFTSMEVGGCAAAMSMPISTVYKPAKNVMFDHVMQSRRLRCFTSLISNDNLRGMIDVLKSGGVCWYGVDQDFGREHSVFAPFFNYPTSTLTLASKIAQRTGAQVVFFYPERLSDAQGYVLHVVPVDDFPSGDLVQDATRYNALIEQVVNRAPENYFWMHRRFKTRPAGENNPYH